VSDAGAGVTRIVSWNIRAGGGTRAAAIAGQLERWAPDLAALSEFRGTPGSQSIADALARQGLFHQDSTANPRLPAENCLLVASRWPLRRIGLGRAPVEPRRWVLLKVDGAGFTVGAMHIPNFVPDRARKRAFMDAVVATAQRWRGGPALFIGDTNLGRPVLDEENPVFSARDNAWFDALERAGWRDSFRYLHGDRREYTWYSPNGRNGFRLDEAFVNRKLLPRLVSVRHEWGQPEGGSENREALSDHAALLVEVG
jgi:exonuclease III